MFSRALPALAHAQLVRSDPPENASLPASPKQVQAWFSEDVEPAFSELTVVDKSDNSSCQRLAPICATKRF